MQIALHKASERHESAAAREEIATLRAELERSRTLGSAIYHVASWCVRVSPPALTRPVSLAEQWRTRCTAQSSEESP